MKAGKIAVQKINEYFSNNVSFNQETTLCGNSIIKNILRAKENGYFVEIHYVGVESVEIAKDRVRYRVEHGGHGIPEKDIERRYSESLVALQKLLSICDRIVLYDNTDQFRRFALYENGKEVLQSNKLPNWYYKL